MNCISVCSNVHCMWDVCFFGERYQFFYCTMTFFPLFVFSISVQVKNDLNGFSCCVCLSPFFLSNFLANLVFKSAR